ncbi:MAG: hypothetical protein ACRDRY_24080 [Pseudonocardiaceae bacterium]
MSEAFPESVADLPLSPYDHDRHARALAGPDTGSSTPGGGLTMGIIGEEILYQQYRCSVLMGAGNQEVFDVEFMAHVSPVRNKPCWLMQVANGDYLIIGMHLAPPPIP